MCSRLLQLAALSCTEHAPRAAGAGRDAQRHLAYKLVTVAVMQLHWQSASCSACVLAPAAGSLSSVQPAHAHRGDGVRKPCSCI